MFKKSLFVSLLFLTTLGFGKEPCDKFKKTDDPFGPSSYTTYPVFVSNTLQEKIHFEVSKDTKTLIFSFEESGSVSESVTAGFELSIALDNKTTMVLKTKEISKPVVKASDLSIWTVWDVKFSLSPEDIKQLDSGLITHLKYDGFQRKERVLEIKMNNSEKLKEYVSCLTCTDCLQ